MKIEAAQRLNAAARNSVWRTRAAYSHPAVTLAQAKAMGFTKGPYYHGTKDRRSYRSILQKGFRSKGAPGWALDNYGEIEEYERWGTTDPVMFTKKPKDAALFGVLVTCYVKPGRVFSAVGMTLFGGLYVKDPADIIPILPETTQEAK